MPRCADFPVSSRRESRHTAGTHDPSTKFCTPFAQKASHVPTSSGFSGYHRYRSQGSTDISPGNLRSRSKAACWHRRLSDIIVLHAITTPRAHPATGQPFPHFLCILLYAGRYFPLPPPAKWSILFLSQVRVQNLQGASMMLCSRYRHRPAK